MISDRHVLVVGKQGLVGTEHGPDRRRVIDARVEVGVVGDRARQVERHVALEVHRGGEQARIVPQRVVVLEEQGEEGVAKVATGRSSESSDVVDGPHGGQRRNRKHAGRGQCPKINDPIANGDAGHRVWNASGGARECAIWQGLDRPLRGRIVGGFDPTASGGVMRVIERRHGAGYGVSIRAASLPFHSADTPAWRTPSNHHPDPTRPSPPRHRGSRSRWNSVATSRAFDAATTSRA